MFTVTWAVLVSLSGLCLVVLEQAPLLLTIIGLLLLYGAAVAHDLHAVVSFRNAAAPKFLTSYGDELLKLQGALQYQKESELQEAKRRSFLSDLRTAKELESVSMLPTLKTPQDIDPESVFSAMIEILMKKVRADGVALVVPTGDAGEISVFQKGLAGK
ncbi:MAG: hypothetical protein KDD62_07390, partial [Bdellovibrionales bacterium]|nr:hypothetical protein [Bdellovibrionales bacterium]